jgi:predicted phage tail protein
MKLKKIKVYGRLRKFLGHSYFEAAVATPKEAFSFLLANFPEVENHMMNQIYKIKMGSTIITEDLLGLRSDEDIQIIPVASGAIVKAVIGAIVSGGAAVATAASGVIGAALTSGIATTLLTTVGTTLIIDGVTSLFAPTPQVQTNNFTETLSPNDPDVASFGFNSITNTTRAGVPVPIIYGEVFTGSIVISSGIDTVQVEGTN